MNRDSPEQSRTGIRKRIPFLKNTFPWRSFIIAAIAIIFIWQLAPLAKQIAKQIKRDPHEKLHRSIKIKVVLRSTLDSLFTRCKRYWDDVGRDKNCTVEKVSGFNNYYFELPQGVNIEASGNEMDFFAIASHKESSDIFVIEADGEISSITHVSLYDLYSEQIREKIPVVGQIRSLAYSADGKLLAFNGDRKRVRILQTGTHREIKELEFTHHVGVITFSNDGALLAVGNSSKGPLGWAQNNAIEIWKISTWERVSTFTESGGGVRSLSFSPDGRFLASAGVDDYAVSLWDVVAGRQIYKLEEHGRQVKVAYSPDGRTLASVSLGSGSDNGIHLREASTGKLLRKLEDPDPRKKNKMRIDSLAFSPDGRMIAAGVNYGSVLLEFSPAIKLWDVTTGEHLREWRVMHDYGYVVAFSPDGKIFAVASRPRSRYEYHISLFDTLSWEAVRKIDTTGVKVEALVFSPDGKTLAFGGYE
jgi:Tol biopolymer transport system component